MGTDRLKFIKGKTFLPSFSDTAQKLNLTTWKGVKSFQRDTVELPRRIRVWDNFQNTILRYYKNFHLGHFTLHGNISLALRTSSFQRLSITLFFFYIFYYALYECGHFLQHISTFVSNSLVSSSIMKLLVIDVWLK